MDVRHTEHGTDTARISNTEAKSVAAAQCCHCRDQGCSVNRHNYNVSSGEIHLPHTILNITHTEFHCVAQQRLSVCTTSRHLNVQRAPCDQNNICDERKRRNEKGRERERQ